ncbi:hypothetical protein [Fibrivirga algicola]|uniref:Cbb3-type cytochrome oxidase assembly protein CcoS n=1 Tax=Fibrivirga algicola TaxID=2950420 RepID=A0ABX0QJY7_9BACT|nr:hypothetical protein [Fibrivirga algicola]NID12775.1 hypothetical protein [Fibrivirga algicola]
MLTSLLIIGAILGVGVVSYVTSARFGVNASQFDNRPMQYAHLRRKLAKAAKKRVLFTDD